MSIEQIEVAGSYFHFQNVSYYELPIPLVSFVFILCCSYQFR